MRCLMYGLGSQNFRSGAPGTRPRYDQFRSAVLIGERDNAAAAAPLVG